jgi:hypothetical protein
MYFIVSWDISAENPLWREINEQMRNCFKNYTQLRPVNTYYLVKISSVEQHTQIYTKLKDVAKAASVGVEFIMTPAYIGKKGFVGILSEKWSDVNAITG